LELFFLDNTFDEAPIDFYLFFLSKELFFIIKLETQGKIGIRNPRIGK
jgi:hypothetical protein